jgi:hypothetical protein
MPGNGNSKSNYDWRMYRQPIIIVMPLYNRTAASRSLVAEDDDDIFAINAHLGKAEAV